MIIDCSGLPPSFRGDLSFHHEDRLPNLFGGVLDIGDVEGVQAPSQLKGHTNLAVVQRELEDYEFVGTHVAEWYQRPENLAAFRAVCPSGYLIFLEKYRQQGRIPMIVTLCVHYGSVQVIISAADDYRDFIAPGDRIAVRRKPSA